MAEPSNADAPARPQRGHARPDFLDDAHDLMAGHDRQVRIGQLAIDHVKVRSAYRTGLDAHPDFTRARRQIRAKLELERLAERSEDHHPHGITR